MCLLTILNISLCVVCVLVLGIGNVEGLPNSSFNQIYLPNESKTPILLGVNDPIFVMDTMPRCAAQHGKEYCIDDPDYERMAHSVISELVARTPMLKKLFPHKEDTFTDGSHMEGEAVSVVSTRVAARQNNQIFESEACAAMERVIYPRRGQTEQNSWVFIANQPSLKQGVRVELCLNPGRSCRLTDGGVKRTICRQKFLYRKVLALSAEGDTLATESVLLPSCCVCFFSLLGTPE